MKRLKRDKIKQQDKNKIFYFYQYKCYYCGKSLLMHEFPHPDYAVIDHVIPVSKGGHQTHLDNLVASCSKCNSVKNQMSVEEYREYLSTKSNEFQYLIALSTNEKKVFHPFKDEISELMNWLSSNLPVLKFYGERIDRKKEGKNADR